MNNKTAVEWLIEQLQAPCRGIPSHIIEQAKEMEKQQIIDAHLIGLITSFEMEATKQATEYYNETYGSKGIDDQVPDVRKMVEDDNYLTPVDWLMDRIKWIHRETYDYLIKEGQYDVAKRTENAILNKANELQSSQTEISDEEIEKFTNEFAEKYSKVGVTEHEVSAFFTGMKWYREQLKQR